MSKPNYHLYDERHVPNNFGLHNIGACCWFNSMMQMLFSLPAITKHVLAHRKEISQTAIGKLYVDTLEYINSRASNPAICSKLAIELLRQFAKCAREKSITINTRGQEGPANGLITFLDILDFDDNGTLYNMLNNRYSIVMCCGVCTKQTKLQIDTGPLVQMYYVHDKINTQELFQEYILKHVILVDDYRCEQCNKTSNKTTRIEQLRMLRECIIITFEKSDKNKYYPDKLSFPTNYGTHLNYELVSLICHSGNYNQITHTSSGHYYAFAKRKGKWVMFNDMTVSESITPSTKNVHMIAYHLVSDE